MEYVVHVHGVLYDPHHEKEAIKQLEYFAPTFPVTIDFALNSAQFNSVSISSTLRTSISHAQWLRDRVSQEKSFREALKCFRNKFLIFQISNMSNYDVSERFLRNCCTKLYGNITFL